MEALEKLGVFPPSAAKLKMILKEIGQRCALLRHVLYLEVRTC